MLKWLLGCKKKSKELLRDSTLGQVMTSCDADIDWDSNKEEIIVANKGEEWQESDDDDSPLEKDNKEEASDNDDMVYDFTCVHH